MESWPVGAGAGVDIENHHKILFPLLHSFPDQHTGCHQALRLDKDQSNEGVTAYTGLEFDEDNTDESEFPLAELSNTTGEDPEKQDTKFFLFVIP